MNRNPSSPVKSAPWRFNLSAGVQEILKLADCAEVTSVDILDVIIIGGGISGLSAAEAGALAGKHVLLLEQEEELGCGASGQNAGIFCAGVNMAFSELPPVSHAAWLWAETLRLQREYFVLAAATDSILQVRRTGALFIARNEAERLMLENEEKAFRAADLPSEIWGVEKIGLETSGLLNTQRVESALYLPDDGRVNPLSLLAHLARNARSSGAQLLGRATVSSYSYDESRNLWIVSLRNGQSFLSRCLVLATGPVMKANKRIYAIAFRADFPDSFPVFQDAAPYTYYDYRAGDGYVIVSGGPYGSSALEETEYFRKMVVETQTWLPELDGPSFEWSVPLNVTADMIPNLCALSGKNGVSIEGLGAFGVLPGLRLGQLAIEKLFGSSC